MRDPLGSTGYVVRGGHRDAPVFVGTCFSFRTSNAFLTAAHAVRDVDVDELSVSIYEHSPARGLEVVERHVHPNADVAVLKTSDWIDIFNPFRDIGSPPNSGDDILCFGYPEDSTETGLGPVPRFFKGHVQRRFEHHSPLGYAYVAYELSFPSPGGLSGGPVASRNNPRDAVGVVVENFESSLYLSKITEVNENGENYRQVVHSVTHYALAVDLTGLQPWLNRVIPRPVRTRQRRGPQGSLGSNKR